MFARHAAVFLFINSTQQVHKVKPRSRFYAKNGIIIRNKFVSGNASSQLLDFSISSNFLLCSEKRVKFSLLKHILELLSRWHRTSIKHPSHGEPHLKLTEKPPRDQKPSRENEKISAVNYGALERVFMEFLCVLALFPVCNFLLLRLRRPPLLIAEKWERSLLMNCNQVVHGISRGEKMKLVGKPVAVFWCKLMNVMWVSHELVLIFLVIYIEDLFIYFSFVVIFAWKNFIVVRNVVRTTTIICLVTLSHHSDHVNILIRLVHSTPP